MNTVRMLFTVLLGSPFSLQAHEVVSEMDENLHQLQHLVIFLIVLISVLSVLLRLSGIRKHNIMQNLMKEKP